MKRNVKRKPQAKGVLRAPGKVLVGGKEWTIRPTSADHRFEGPTMFGRCRPEYQEIIYLDDNTEEGIKDTILHELIHALEWHGQLGFKERQVHVLASLLLECMWDNPELFVWLMLNSKRKK